VIFHDLRARYVNVLLYSGLACSQRRLPADSAREEVRRLLGILILHIFYIHSQSSSVNIYKVKPVKR
jgi:hypothetical protein